ncbi:MAG: tetratricopeptide repeat protein [Aquaticitalea sp.]
MTDLKAIISTFSIEDQQQFIRFLEDKNKRGDTKNVQLFKLLVKGEDSKDICFKLYNDTKKNAYHALRKRLYQSLTDFIANSKMEDENSVDMQLIKYIIASRNFLLHNQFKVAYKILDKAETLAKEHHLFSILNEIYHTKIQYAYTNPDVDIEVIVKAFKINQKLHFTEDQLNIVYAKIRQTLNDMTYKGEVVDFQTLLNQTLDEHNIDINEALSFKSLYQLMTIVSISAFVTNDYLKIETFLIHTYASIQQHKTRDKQLYYHIEVLYMIANTLFRNKKFEESLTYLNQMHQVMRLQKNKHYNTFKLKYHLLLSLNYNYSNEQTKAIALLEQFKIKNHPDIESLLDIYLSLIMFYIQNEDYQKARQLFSKFYHTDQWYIEKAGKEWTIKKNLIEIILYIELNEMDLVESRLKSFRRNYSLYLKQIQQERVLIYLSLVENYFKNPEKITTTKFHKKVEQSFEWIDAQQEDIFVMSFYAWLKSKMEGESLFKTTLKLIKMAQAVN